MIKKNYFLLLFLAAVTTLKVQAQYSSQNITFVGNWYNPSQPPEPTYGIKYNSVWGWVDTADSNKEYAILGSGLGTHIIDISVPSNPVQIDFVAGRRDECIWREYKTYGNYLYAISDDGAPNSFQIIDMSYLPDSVHVVHDDTTIVERAHTLFIEGDKLYIGSVKEHSPGGGVYSMAVYSLANPEVPLLLRALNQDYPSITWVHDMYVRNDTVYASCGFDGLYIYKYNAGTNNFTALNSLTSYPDQGYNHSSALTPNSHTLVFCDEVPENTLLKVLDVTDVTNLSILDTFKSNEGATPHNPYIWGTDRVVIAYYQDGLQIFDISNPTNVTKTGFFDTDTLHGLNDGFPAGSTYHGAWGAYIDLPSGLFLVGDMQNGLFVLNPSLALGVTENNINENNVSVFPNPTNNYCSITINLTQSEAILFELFDVTGKKIFSKAETIGAGNSTRTILMDQYKSGMYILKMTGKDIYYTQKIIKK